MNILLTSAGRRTSLVTAFMKAAGTRDGTVFAGDADSLAPALVVADKGLRLPRIEDPAYIPHLLDVVRECRISMLVPTIDTDLQILAHHVGDFENIGCTVAVSSESLISTCRDKWKSVEMFSQNGVRVPDSWLPRDLTPERIESELPEKLFVKPRGGSSSINTFAVDRADLLAILPFVPDPIVQKRIDDPEITVDALLALDGQLIHFVPRDRIRTSGGESIQGVTLGDPRLSEWIVDVFDIVGKLGGRGPLTLQAFLTEGEPTLSELNPRFGGGFPLALAAGGDYPEWLIQMVEGKQVEPRIGQYQKDLFMTRHYQEIFLEKRPWG